MIELTEQQAEAIELTGAAPHQVLNPRTQETFVLLRADAFERLKEEAYDDSPWTRQELQALAWERIKDENWDEYNDSTESHVGRAAAARTTRPGQPDKRSHEDHTRSLPCAMGDLAINERSHA